MSLKMILRNIFSYSKNSVLDFNVFCSRSVLLLNIKNFPCSCSRTTCVFFHPWYPTETSTVSWKENAFRVTLKIFFQIRLIKLTLNRNPNWKDITRNACRNTKMVSFTLFSFNISTAFEALQQRLLNRIASSARTNFSVRGSLLSGAFQLVNDNLYFKGSELHMKRMVKAMVNNMSRFRKMEFF